ncbi:hypothetical protein [Streptomyces griseiscabiei]|uniref:Phage protein n=1 Tax=Streptomyces griseiscabiei TaxID=2993540 RepID=A0ABU4LLV7_9ACTN|nr:hypothetical protein [Streptomyces griseiscabiei]MBZ3908859.1 hypothetical protein [Streptomyces griseiscabiei]MDX2916134.1 hypothetical protein [Streptomyces griseiscabiei]
MGRRVEPGKPGAGAGGHRRPQTTTELALALPEPPSRPIASTPVLITEEEDVFLRCEVAIENLKVAFWAAGKALGIIREGRLYRAEYATFDDYCWQRWGMGRGQANKLIRMWPIAEAMFESLPSESNDLARTRAKKLSQSVVWELVPIAESYDVEAATAVYTTTAEADEAPVTAEVLRGIVKDVVKVLPKGQSVDKEALASVVREALQRVPSDKKQAAPKKKAAPAAAKTDPAALTLPWDSPEALNRLLRQHMTDENRRTLGKLLAED